ncbi:adenylate/guanylate cyclase domain-containing protein [Gracilinema caldarium]|uniref:adenylate/guanylate cyclase domain-containing protein n=1 Tax=Gracilinema caldarium TaxID=215591 RepID=UPI0026F24773|nr:adenylate/guanylate cyclase domain-containing protein [Gracilinema caldarium]
MDEKEYRLAAIMYTDIAGFSRMMETNEKRTLELLTLHNGIIEAAVKQFRGTVIKTIGDAYMVDFKNSVDALNCALKVQYDLYDYNKQNKDLPLLVRIGLHIGDIYFYENDALGEGINIAARLQSIAHPGCICMSQHLYNLVLNKVDFAAEKLGKVSLKNITKEIIAYEIVTPNVEFDPNRDARPVLKPDKVEKGVVMEGDSGSSQIDEPDKRLALKKAILSDIQSSGKRMTVEEARKRFAAEMPVAEDVIEELATKGILRSEPLFIDNSWSSSELGETLSEVAREVSSAFKEAVEIAREEYRSERHRLRSEYRDGRVHRRSRRGQEGEIQEEERLQEAAAGGKSEGTAPVSDGYESYDEYVEKLEREARHATGGFVGHLVPFVMVNGFLMTLNAAVSPGFPWALFPFGGWGIGLLEHFAGALRTKEKYRELAKLPPLSDEQLSIFKKLQKKKDELWQSGTGFIPTSLFLFMINIITSRGFLWSLIPIFFMTMGFFGKLVKMPGEIAALNQDLKDALRNKGTRSRRQKSTAAAPSGPYAALVQEAFNVRDAILEMVQEPSAKERQKGTAKADLPEADELIPVLNAYVEQVQLLADRTAEVDRIIELIPRTALQRDKEVLERKLQEQSKPELRKEYERALAELEQQETSFMDLGEQRDLLELKLRSSVNNLKQMQIDIGRIISLTGSSESGADRSLHYKTEELNRYLEDLRSGYEEVERIENKATQISLEER